MTKTLFALLLIVLATPALAQPATVAVFSSTALDANTATPVMPAWTYAAPVCGQRPKLVEAPPIVNADTGAYDDPTDATADCRLDLRPQLAALPLGSYRAAVKGATTTFGTLSTAFTMAAQAVHPCDGADPVSGTVAAGSRTLSWCYPDNTTGGSPITGWAVYVGTTRTTPTVTTGTTVNAAGRRLYTSVITVTAGSLALQVAAFNAIGEGAKSATFALTVQAPATAPTGTSGIKGVN